VPKMRDRVFHEGLVHVVKFFGYDCRAAECVCDDTDAWYACYYRRGFAITSEATNCLRCLVESR